MITKKDYERYLSNPVNIPNQLDKIDDDIRRFTSEINALHRVLRYLRDLKKYVDDYFETIEGVHIFYDGYQMYTLMDDEGSAYCARIYEKQFKDSKNEYAVNINERNDRKYNNHMPDRWFGGKVIGLDKRWTHEQALTAAKEWLVHQKLP